MLYQVPGPLPQPGTSPTMRVFGDGCLMVFVDFISAGPTFGPDWDLRFWEEATESIFASESAADIIDWVGSERNTHYI